MRDVNNISKYLIHLFISVSALIILIAVTMEYFFTPKLPSVIFSEFNSGWSVYYNGKKYFTDDISSFHFPAVIKKGDQIILRNTLPEDLPDNYSLSLLVSLSGVKAYVEGRDVYSLGMDEINANKTAPSCYHYIPFPNRAAGDIIVIEIHPSELNAFTNIGNINIIRSDIAYFILAYKNRSTLFVAIFLVTLGIIAFIIGVLISVYKRCPDPLIHIGSLSFFMGVWSLCYENLMQLFSHRLIDITLLEYFVLYASIIPALFLVRYYLLDNNHSGGSRREINLLILLACIFLLTATILHFTDILHFPATLTFFHIMVIGMLITIYFSIRKTDHRKHAYGIIMQFGMIELCLIAALDLIRFNFQKYIAANDASLGLPLMPYGTLIFIMILFTSYLLRSYLDMKAKVAAETEKEVLLKMAYNDRLTGLYNRTKGEELLQELNDGEQDYCIISIDLNGLKKINDNYGHRKGDLLLVTFSKILKRSFGRTGIPVRMGGDEFMVVIFKENFDYIDNAIESMKEMSKEDSAICKINIDASYGIAKNSEDDLQNAEDVYKLADQRMYEMKVASKKNRTD